MRESAAFRLLLYPIGKFFLFLLFLICGPTIVKGRQRVPRRGGLLVVANHTSDADPPLVGYAVPRPSYFMAKSELFEIRILGRLLRWYRSFPVRRGAPDRAALRKAIDLLRAGECVVMFPEGECSESGKLQRILPGAALIIRQAEVATICSGIQGVNRMLPYGKLIPRPAFRKIVVEFGETKRFSKESSEEEIIGWMEAELKRLSNQ